MHKRYSAILLPVVILLFVGSSGCESSDIMTAMEVLGGSQGITAIDVAQKKAPKMFGGGSTGDKEKDDMIDVAETMEKVRQAGELEDGANEDLAQDPPKFDDAVKKLLDAIKLRPNDWSLQNQLNAVQGERNLLVKQKSPYAVCGGSVDLTAREKRCIRSFVKDEGRTLETSIARQKQRGQQVACGTYSQLEEAYEWVARLAPSDAVEMGFSLQAYDHMVSQYEAARNFAAHPGQSCAYGGASST